MVTNDYIKSKAIALAALVREDFSPSQQYFFKNYSHLEDLLPEEDQSIVEKAWAIWLNREEESCLSDLAEEIRPKRRFLSPEIEAKVQTLLSDNGNITLEHDEAFAIHTCAQAEFRGFPWSLPNYPAIQLARLPKKWWSAEGERS